MTAIYLDNSATTRPYDTVIDLMAKVQGEVYGNPSSMHAKGLDSERIIGQARCEIARLFRGRENEIYFTSGGTEANNLAIKGNVHQRRRQGNHIITSSIEHHSVLNCCRFLEQEGFMVSYLPVNDAGFIALDELERVINENTIMVSIGHVNNEIGTIQPLKKIGALIKRHSSAIFHIDAVQSFARLPLELSAWQADLVSCSAHKIHGPKGSGCLWIREGVRLQPLMQGGNQEKGLRPGTEDTAGIAGFGLAAKITEKDQPLKKSFLEKLNFLFCLGLQKNDLKFFVNGTANPEGASHILNLSFPGIKAEVLLHALEQRGIFTSAGSACHARRPEPSHVLQAIGLRGSRLDSAIRFSFSHINTEAEVETAVRETVAAVKELSPMILKKRC
ncbi:MAG TPA: cysteine desulfurase family protein [Candidatus Limnocylindrales bacterium]|nr:cysteine desulfurase family protein [Candidatus Limnocylindrales bacterium]